MIGVVVLFLSNAVLIRQFSLSSSCVWGAAFFHADVFGVPLVENGDTDSWVTTDLFHWYDVIFSLSKCGQMGQKCLSDC